jgi:predicted membrane channel-forming protein YqfA (hemolysin III family)
MGDGYEYALGIHLNLIFIVSWQIGAPGVIAWLLFPIPEQAAVKILFVYLLLGTC